MSNIFKIIILSIGSCLLLIGVFIALSNLFHLFLYDLVVKLTHKWLIAQLSVTDLVLFWGYPIGSGILFVIYDKNIRIQKLIQVNAQILITVLLCLFIGCAIAVFTWSPDSELLPSHIVVQPSYFYWTPFILTGIVIPLCLWLRKRSKKHFNQHVIDEEIK